MTHAEAPQKYVLVIARESVETRNLSPVLNVLNSVEFAEANPTDLIGCITLFIDGYDDDPRELHEFPAVRVFCRALEKAVPHILFYLSIENGSVTLFCAAAWAKSRAEGIAYIPTSKTAQHVKRSYHAMNAFCERVGMVGPCEKYGQHCTAIAQVLSADSHPIQ